MNLEDKVYNLEHSVNELKVSMATVEATLPSLAKESELANVKATLSSLAKESDLVDLKTRFETTIPTLARQEDLKELKTKFESTLPHLVTKTWLFTGLISLIIAQIFIPSVRVIFHLV